ncbi:hypothetical protein [Oecophyllibacter saccharovorans]|uniref:hypothetical protein n=1 Tax=Oecophyllibacter saccharovorans TaxID=2558360 RepID=UPI00114326CD|nr:hypothetical protein [Oecophyllibacter saccharovorans]QDH14708.1 hypothetical protein E3E11_01245 [Oecophyllibacter saccharovorans]TPW34908.1 hypothetical protein E3203_05225 [Oecophyllibacter saccharovorans]
MSRLERARQQSEQREKAMRRLETGLQGLAFALEQRDLQEEERASETEAAFRLLEQKLAGFEDRLRALLETPSQPAAADSVQEEAVFRAEVDPQEKRGEGAEAPAHQREED